jgi:hypothetical protein
VYGPTETTIWSSAINVKHTGTINIGKPIANTYFYILDENNHLTPLGGIGELCIGGQGIALGYWKRDELTAEKFIEVDFQASGLIYKTGDVARLNSNGEFECYGRQDSQIKIHGNRVELGEIEAVITNYPGIKSAVVNLIHDGENKSLAAYYILNNSHLSIKQDRLHDFLMEKLPTSMLPSAYLALDEFPMTYNKKIDRKNLPLPKKEFGNILGRYVAPANEVEQVIQKIWEDVLSIKNISVVDNFFMVGGNSLHIPMIVIRINDHFGLSITLRDFILNSTIQANASMIQTNCKKTIIKETQNE